MLNPIHLATLRAVVSSGSFNAAASRVGYTASAVSQQMGALERAVGVPLFERSASSTIATATALYLAEESEEILTRLQTLEVAVRRHSGTVPTLRLGSFTTAARHLLPSALAGAFVSTGAVDVHQIDGRDDMLVPLIDQDELDLAIVYRYSGVPTNWPPHLVVRHLLHEPMLLLLRDSDTLTADALARDGIAALAEQTWITLDGDQPHHRALVAACGEAGFAPQISLEVPTTDVLPALVAAGIGAAIVSRLGFQPHAGVAAHPLPLTRQVYAVSPDRAHALVDTVVTELRIAAQEWLAQDSVR